MELKKWKKQQLEGIDQIIGDGMSNSVSELNQVNAPLILGGLLYANAPYKNPYDQFLHF